MSKQKRSTGYQVCIHVGPRPDGVSPSARFVELDLAHATPDTVLTALGASGLLPSDFRAEVVCSFECDRDTAILVYAALCGFAQRRIDVISAGRIVAADKIDKLARSVADSGKPESVPAQVQVGVVPHESLPSVLFSAQLSPTDASTIRYARRVRFAPAAEITAAITQLLVLTGIRARGTTDRFPYLVNGDEAAPSQDAPLAVAGVCLDTLRADALGLRRQHRSGDRRAMVDRPPTSTRRDDLTRAAEVPIEDALRLLGGRQNPDTGLWHCPRPTRHNNGDANASMRAVKGLVRCYRCDGERVDSLRLAMDVLGLGPDEAAAWLVHAASAASSAELDELFS